MLMLCPGYGSNPLAQGTASFVVKGDINTYYPVVFYDAGWDYNVATELSIGRSNVHKDADWRGSFIARFRYHTNNWGNGANFINAEIASGPDDASISIGNFVGGWEDVTVWNGVRSIIIWLRGGTTTYFFQSNYAITPTVYDGVQNDLPYKPTADNSGYYAKTTVDPDVNKYGASLGESIFVTATSPSYIQGNLSIGTPDAKGYKLAVNGAAVFEKAVVKMHDNWPDYVFDTAYQLPRLDSVATYIQQNKHLPEVPSGTEVQQKGVDLATNQAVLLKKIEELTLYMIDIKKQNDQLSIKNHELEQKVNQLQDKVDNRK
ncbi:hypothetical protein DXN05_09860 [Deminuibacter soli]|uniref:Uncharacterized protein n=2 Tax=Deminuibacter soli TaxID=2291815 RepID=A0A3E1NMA2_9BACT|nr:hypothetical protein DXN05_09860 [Deminuibacter soli]